MRDQDLPKEGRVVITYNMKEEFQGIAHHSQNQCSVLSS